VLPSLASTVVRCQDETASRAEHIVGLGIVRSDLGIGVLYRLDDLSAVLAAKFHQSILLLLTVRYSRTGSVLNSGLIYLGSGYSAIGTHPVRPAVTSTHDFPVAVSILKANRSFGVEPFTTWNLPVWSDLAGA
jgi:hypothetical protein